MRASVPEFVARVVEANAFTFEEVGTVPPVLPFPS